VFRSQASGSIVKLLRQKVTLTSSPGHFVSRSVGCPNRIDRVGMNASGQLVEKK
jgi:hypothetical protein